MTSETSPTYRLAWYYRLALIVAGGVLITLLAIAAALQPDDRGFGTHEQIPLLKPCSFKELFGFRCPSCGMTTSWSLMTKGRVVEAVESNAGGAFLAVLAAVLGVWTLGSGLRGRWLWRPVDERIAAATAVLAFSVTAVDWCVRLFLLP